LHGGLHPDRRDLRPGADQRHRLDAFQEAPVSSIMGSVAKHIFLVTDPDKLEATVRTAFEIARTGRPGPWSSTCRRTCRTGRRIQGLGHAAHARLPQALETLTTDIIDGTEANHFFEMLGESQRPLIYAGGGVINGNASAELREFAQEFDIPVVTTLMGIGAMDTTSSLAMRMLGMHGQAFANYAVDDCDFLIAIGARFDDRVAGNPAKFAPGAKYIAHFDIDRAEINKVKRVQWSHVGMLPEALNMLTAHGRRSGFKRDRSKWLAYLADLKRTYAMNYDRASEKIQPYYVIEELNRVTKGEAIISTGVGQHQMWAAQYCDFRNPRQWLTSGSMGTMGFGLPAAIGAQFAQREKLVIDIDGDASVRMNFGELETVTTYDLPVKVVILNNNGDGMVKQWQKLFFKGRLSASEKTLHTKGLHQGRAGRWFQIRRSPRQEVRCSARHRRIPRVQRCGFPRGHHRSGCRRVSHGGSGPALRGHDHRRLDSVAQEGGREAAGRREMF
jgi:acetolactate synthase-1/2/3 large subunit